MRFSSLHSPYFGLLFNYMVVPDQKDLGLDRYLMAASSSLRRASITSALAWPLIGAKSLFLRPPASDLFSSP
jgi:hypothetical protein